MKDIIFEHDSSKSDRLLQVSISYRPGAVNWLGHFQVFKKGTKAFGHADELMRFCPNTGCTNVFEFDYKPTDKELDTVAKLPDPEDMTQWPKEVLDRLTNWYDDMMVCPKCAYPHVRSDQSDSYGFNTPKHRVAYRMAQMFTELGGCDVYLVRTKSPDMLVKGKQMLRNPDLDVKAYNKTMAALRDREQAYYSYEKITQDLERTNLAAAFEAFLGA